MSQPYIDHRPTSRAFHGAGARAGDDHRLERLIRRLPEHRQASARWLRSPAARWVRVPLGILFILGSFLFILPIFGLWMLPFGLLLLAEDVPALRRLRTRVLDWLERRWPHWFAEHPEAVARRQAMNKEETT